MRKKPFLKAKGAKHPPKQAKPVSGAPKLYNPHATLWFPQPVAKLTDVQPKARIVSTMSPAAIAALKIIERQPVYFDGRYWNDYFMQGVSYIPQTAIAELRRFKAVRMVGGLIVPRERREEKVAELTTAQKLARGVDARLGAAA